MKAVVMHRRGGVEQLVYEDFPTPEIGPTEVLLRVRACALNRLDIFARQGSQAVKVRLPHILGLEAAGDIVAVGEEVDNVRVGDQVVMHPTISCGTCVYCRGGHDNLCTQRRLIGVHVHGGYAEYLKAPARNAIPLPRNFSYEEAAAVPVAFGTAWHMLVTRAQLQAGETVLILAAGSGVSTAAIQIAKLKGARVIAAASSDEKLERARELGADEVINYGRERQFQYAVRRLTDGLGVDVVFEHVGPDTWQQSMASLAPLGRIVTCGATTGRWGRTDLWSLFDRERTILGSWGAALKDFYEVSEEMGKGRLKPVIARVFPLTEAREAHRLLESRDVFGKIILKP